MQKSVAEKNPALEIRNLSVIYQSDRGSTTAVQNLDLTVQNGEFVSVLGPSGCGKSTALSVVAGLLAPTFGTVSVFGQTIHGAPHPKTGIVFQRPTLLPWQTVLQNVLIPVMAARLPTANYTTRALELLDMVGLKKFARHYPNELSGGMQQRVSMARALILDPNLLLMDEPFAALDAMTRERMAVDLLEIWEASKKSVLFITHSVPEAVFLSDRVVMMSSSPGRVIEDVRIDLPRPRTEETMATPEFAAFCGALRKMYIE